MRELRLIEAVCLVCGAGVGGGVMAVPYLAANVGMWPTILIMLAAYLVTATLHLMVAELSIRTECSSELLTVFSRHLFKNRRSFRIVFYVLMAITLICILAAYITGAGEILADLFSLPPVLASILFFTLAALVVFLGLKRIAMNEVAAIAVMLVLLSLLVISTVFLPEFQPLASANWEFLPILAVYGMVMFSLSSLFSVPQAAAGLRGNKSRLRIAVCLGLLINLIVTATITLCVLVASNPVTEVAIIGWAGALGGYTRILGSLFIVLAMLTTFWSISLQLSDMTKEFFRAGRLPSWLAATFPSLLLALLPLSGFLALMQIAGGATAVIVAVMAVPAYRNAVRGADGLLLGSPGKSRTLCGIIIAMYLLMAIASFV